MEPESFAADLPTDLDAATVHEALIGLGAHEGAPFTIIDLLDTLPWFETGADWTMWRAFLKAVYGLEMNTHELQIYRECTGRHHQPERQIKEGWCACGRRARKSAVAGLVGVYQAVRRDYRPFLARDERAVVLVMSKNMRDAQQIHGYQKSILQCDAMRHHLAGDPLQEKTSLQRNVDICVLPATPTGGRVRACVCALLDEIAFFQVESETVNDKDIVTGIKPSMAGKPDTLLLGFSSPWAKRGVLYEAFERLWGQDNERELFWKAPTTKMNPDPLVAVDVAEAYEDDPVGADIEFGANFRPDELMFVDPEVVKARTVIGMKEVAPCSFEPVGFDEPEPVRFNYYAFADPSGGSSDWFTLAIAHWDHLRRKVILDCLRSWAPTDRPFNPKEATEGAVLVMRLYNLTSVTGDAYGGQWPVAEFNDYGIQYIHSTKPKTDIYRDFLPALNRDGIVELLDDKVLARQLVRLRRRLTPKGQEIIDHPKGEKDDVANAACGAMELVYREGRYQNPPEVPRKAQTVDQVWSKEIRQMEEAASQGYSDNDIWHTRWET